MSYGNISKFRRMVLNTKPGYRSYLLRIWQTTQNGVPAWRVSLRDVVTQEWKGFADLESLVAFLQQQTAQGGQMDEDEEESCFLSVG